MRGEGGLELHLTARADFDGPYLLYLPESLAGVPELSLPEGMEGVAADDFVFLRNCEMKQGDERVVRLAAQG